MDAIDLSRFTLAHRRQYDDALREIRSGRKKTHWMWFIFPQLVGLGFSPTARYYGIHDQEEARAFLSDEYLGGNLREITQALLSIECDDAHKIFGAPDDLKLRSSMTLFASVSEQDSIFLQVLDKFFGGAPDPKTLSLLNANLR